MNSYISQEEALKKGIDFWASKVDVDGFANDPIKKQVIEAIKDGSWVDKFCYKNHLEWFEIQEYIRELFSSEPGFGHEDFYANETFVMFVKYSSVSDWMTFLDVRLKRHLHASRALSDFYEMMRNHDGLLSKEVADNCRLVFSYYLLNSGVVEYLIEYGDFDKIKEFVLCEKFSDARNLHVVVRGKLDNLFSRFIDRDDFGMFFDFWITLVKREEFNNFRLKAEVMELFFEKHPNEYAIYQNLLKENLQ